METLINVINIIKVNKFNSVGSLFIKSKILKIISLKNESFSVLSFVNIARIGIIARILKISKNDVKVKERIHRNNLFLYSFDISNNNL